VNTGAQGYTFIKLDSGMSEIMRPSLYGAQHPIVNLSRPHETQVKDFVVVSCKLYHSFVMLIP
jgi:diaminopimelate decarboxylase